MLSGTNAPPVAYGGSFAVTHDSAVNFPGFYAYDPDGDALTFALTDPPDHGSLAPAGGSAYAYIPDAGYVGSDSFVYTADDGQATSSATVSIAVTNETPVVYGGSESLHHDTAFSSGIYGSDPDGDAVTLAVVSGPEHGTLSLDAYGSYTYTPDAGYVGSDEFAYTATDGLATSGAATVSFDVTNATPVVYDASESLHHDSALTWGGVYGYDPDGDVLTYALVAGPAHGTLNLASGGSYSYTPDAGYVGSDEFSYTATDGLATSRVATVSFDMTNQTPLVYDYGSESLTHRSHTNNSALTSGVYGYDPDGDVLTYALVSGPSHGSLSLDSNGSYVYTPDVDYVGSDEFAYTATDGIATSAAATVQIDVTDQAPWAGGGGGSALHDHVLHASLSSYDPEDDTLTYAVVTGPSFGTLSGIGSDGSYAYTPNAGYVGPDEFLFSVSDPWKTSDTAAVEIDVTNQAPIANGGSASVLHDRVLNAAVPASDPDGDTLTYSLVSGPSFGTITPLGPDGSYTYTPNAGYVGSDEFSYKVSDGAAASGVKTIVFEVFDNAPVISGGSAAVPEGTAVGTPIMALTVTDPDGEGGWVTVSGGPFAYDDATHSLLLTGPLDRESGPSLFPDSQTDDRRGYRVTVTAFDGAKTTTAVFVIEITNVPPVFGPAENPTIGYGSLTAGRVVGTYVAADPGEESYLTYSVSGAGLSIDQNGVVTITDAAAAKAAYDSAHKIVFTVTADDGLASDTVTVTIYDDYGWYLDEARRYIGAWQTMMQDLITDTSANAHQALLDFDRFIGSELSSFGTAAGGAASLLWILPEGALAEAGDVITGLAIEAYTAKQEDGYDATLAEFERLYAASIQSSRDAISSAELGPDGLPIGIAEREIQEINNLESDLDNNPNLSPDAKAQQAADRLNDLMQRYPLGKTPPSTKEMQGKFLVKYAQDNGLTLYGSMPSLRDYGYYWTGYGLSWPWIDSKDMAEELNRIGYTQGETCAINY